MNIKLRNKKSDKLIEIIRSSRENNSMIKLIFQHEGKEVSLDVAVLDATVTPHEYDQKLSEISLNLMEPIEKG